MGDTFSSGKSAAKRSARAQTAELDKQKKIEQLRTAEETSEIERRKAVAKRGGTRSSLLATSETGATGLAKTLGG